MISNLYCFVAFLVCVTCNSNVVYTKCGPNIRYQVNNCVSKINPVDTIHCFLLHYKQGIFLQLASRKKSQANKISKYTFIEEHLKPG